MSNEHNPIALLVSKIQKNWIATVSTDPQTRLVRWLIQPQESKLYEGVLKLESSAHGQIPEVFVVLLTPFDNDDSYSEALINGWLEAYEKDRVFLHEHQFNWDATAFRKNNDVEPVDKDRLLLDMLQSYREAVAKKNTPINLVLYPRTVSDISAFSGWLNKVRRLGVPEDVRLVFFDLLEQRFYDKLCNSIEDGTVKTIRDDINYQQAVKKVMQSGDPNDPGFKLRQYIQTMGEAVAHKQLDKLNRLGKDCMEEMTRCKIKSLMATACIAYAGMLFNFRKYQEIDQLLEKGLKIAVAGADSDDAACKALIIQFYNFKASNFQLEKKFGESIEWFCKSAELSKSQGLLSQSLNAYYQASSLAQKHSPQYYPRIAEIAFQTGKNISKEEMLLSAFPAMATDYHRFLHFNGDEIRRDEVDDEMKLLLADEWKPNLHYSNSGATPANMQIQ